MLFAYNFKQKYLEENFQKIFLQDLRTILLYFIYYFKLYCNIKLE